FYNETDGHGIWPTPTVGGLGLLADLDRMATIAYPSGGLVLLLIGETFGWLGSSLYLREVCGREEGAPPSVDLATERRHGDLVRSLCAHGLIETCHDLSDGGLYAALAEMVLASGIGADLTLPEGCDSAAAWLFGEDQSRYLIAVAPDRMDEVHAQAARAGVLLRRVGTTGGVALTLDGVNAISLEELAEIHSGWLPSLMGAS
ncbi:MAG: AIR synthase-related protein, partial [Pseudomonadota bacterium]